MFTLATPLGLLGLTALALPLWLHLVRRPARVVRVASLRFLPKDRVRLKAVHLRDPWLFLLRCALICGLVLLLSGPRWLPDTAPSGRWRVLHPRAALTETERQRWDAAGREGLADWPGAWPVNRSTWSFVADLDRRVGPNSELVVFGPADGEEARSVRPRLHHLRIRWVETPAGPSAAAPAAGIERVALLAGPDRGEDVRHVRAALEAVAESSPGQLVVVTESPTTVIRLGETALPRAWLPRRLFTDSGAVGDERSVSRVVRLAERSYPLARRVAPGPGPGVVTDSEGEALLTVKVEAGVECWTWAGRFHPEWTAWVASPGFALAWREWLLGDQRGPAAEGAQAISVQQLTPQLDEDLPGSTEPPPRDLRPLLWWVVLGLFVGERFVAWRRGRNVEREVSR